MVFLLAGNGFMSFAQQLPSEGTWGKKNVATIASGEVTLTGDIRMKGPIRIAAGTSLTIRSSTDVTIYNDGIVQNGIDASDSGMSRMFTINSGSTDMPGGKLTIIAENGATITIDGGADYTWEDYTLKEGPDSRSLTTCFATGGTVNLENVTIQNVKGYDSSGGAFDISSKAGKTTLTGCTITRCTSERGAAIFTESRYPLTITDSEISYCNSGGGTTNNSGGAIRTLGSTSGDLILKNVMFRYNYARRNEGFDNILERDGNGGALFWNGRGTLQTTCYIDGCMFEHNKCDDNGGAIKAQGSIKFINTPTVIQNNTAPFGAGIFVEGYTGSVELVNTESHIVYDLNEFLILRGNRSTSYTYDSDNYPGMGAGIHFCFNDRMTLEANSSISVDINGAIIENNSIEGDNGLGGGIYFENTSPAHKNYTFTINLNHGTVSGNHTTDNGRGGGIYVYKEQVISNKVEGKKLTVSNNASGSGGGIYIENGDFTIDAGEISGNTVASGHGAGVYIVGSNGKGNFTMNGGEIKKNMTSGHNGGGVYINGGNFTLNKGSITENSAKDGGGVCLNNGNFSLVTGEISKNTAIGYGGGVYLTGENCVYRLKNGAIGGNIAQDGGGVYLANGSFILAESISDSGSISGNTASGNGGGVFIAGSGDFTMNGGTVEKNYTSGSNGGGIFLNGGNFKMTDGSISGNGKDTGGNTSTENGGGVYLNGGSIEVEKGSISSNASTANGGGVYIMNGEVRMGSGYINGNSCGQYGGGVYVFNSSADKTTVSFNGGTLTENTAKYGGGVCVDGLIDMTIGNVEIAENSATNGGGVCLMNSAHMNFGTGEIKNNKALTSTAFTTGYKKDIGTVEGFGGGVFLDSDTSLEFGTGTDLGLFGNIADNGGDEIFANGMNTTVDLPDVTNMALGGYDGASNLKWIEDYPTDDPHYDSGTKLKGSAWDSDKTNLRYRDAMAQNATIYNLSGAAEHDARYICFALGYEVIYITVTKYGLEKGESSIFHLSKSGAHDFRIVITGDGSEKVSKRVAVTAGEWSIRETPWSWTYDLTGSDGNALPERTITKDIADEGNRLFVFKGNRTGAFPMNSEDIEVNIMGN